MPNRLLLRLLAALFVCAGLCSLGKVYAKILTMKSPKGVDRFLAKKPFSVVLFYYEKKRRSFFDPSIEIDPDVNMQRLTRMFTSLSESRMYQDADMQFLRVNIADKELGQLAREYGIKKVPSWILFRDGEIMRDTTEQKNGVSLSGSVTYKQLRNFINKNLRDDIQDYLERKNKERRLGRSNSNSSVYFGYGYPGYAPYYGYGSGATLGFGFSI